MITYITPFREIIIKRCIRTCHSIAPAFIQEIQNGFAPVTDSSAHPHSGMKPCLLRSQAKHVNCQRVLLSKGDGLEKYPDQDGLQFDALIYPTQSPCRGKFAHSYKRGILANSPNGFVRYRL